MKLYRSYHSVIGGSHLCSGITCQPKILILFSKVLYVSVFLILCHTCMID